MKSVSRTPNSQNGRVWTTPPDEVPDDQKYREMVKNPACVGIFVMYCLRKLIWVIKPRVGMGLLLQNINLAQHVILFLKDPACVLNVEVAAFSHDKAPCMKAHMTQQLLKSSKIEIFRSSE